jgi:hypothetical protein
LFTALIVLLVSCSSALLTSSSNQPPNITNYFCEKHQLFLTTLPCFYNKEKNTLNFKEVIKEKPKEKPITTRDYYETYSGGCGNTYGGFSRSGGC